MRDLLRADLLSNLRVWIGTFVVLVAAAVAAGLPATLIDTATHAEMLTSLALLVLASTLIVLTTISVTVVLTSAVRSLVELRRRSFALWLIVGMQPRQVARIILGQIAIVAVAAAAVGGAVAAAVCPPVVGALLGAASGIETVRPTLGLPAAAICSAVVVLVTVLATMPLARQAGFTRPIAVLRGEAPGRGRPVVRIVLAVLLLVLAASMIGGLPGALANGASQSVLIGPVLIAAVSVVAQFIVPGIVRAWTALIPADTSVTWLLARASVIDAARRSSASIVSFTVALGLPWTFLVGQQTIATATAASGGAGLDPRSLGLLMGGPTLLAAVGAAAGVFMASDSREHESALLTVAGAAPSTRLLTAVWEALIYVVTAAILSGAVVVVVALGSTLVLLPTAPAVRPEFGLAYGAASVAACLLLAWAATFAPMLARPRDTVAVLTS
jgi:putative ABC transport system permease protein